VIAKKRLFGEKKLNERPLDGENLWKTCGTTCGFAQVTTTY